MTTAIATPCASCRKPFAPVRSTARLCDDCRSGASRNRRYRARLIGKPCIDCGDRAARVVRDKPYCRTCITERHRRAIIAKRRKTALAKAPESIDHLHDWSIDPVIHDAPITSSGAVRWVQARQDEKLAELEAFATVMLFDSDSEIARARPVLQVDASSHEFFDQCLNWLSLNGDGTVDWES